MNNQSTTLHQAIMNFLMEFQNLAVQCFRKFNVSQAKYKIIIQVLVLIIVTKKILLKKVIP
jgi:hypothetical protein